jgi:hypothetical protein
LFFEHRAYGSKPAIGHPVKPSPVINGRRSDTYGHYSAKSRPNPTALPDTPS